MSREVHVRFCERLEVKSPGPTLPPASLGWDFDIALECGGIRIKLDGAPANNDHPLTEPFYFRDVALHSLDDDRS